MASPRVRLLALASLLLSSLGVAPARAEPALESYVVVVGSNVGGAGQRPLEHAEADAERMAQLFVELGRVDARHVTLLRKPTPEQVESQLHTLQQQLEARRAAGRQTQVLFYYSGHARAQGLSLGNAELPLSTLRSALAALPSTLTVVVLDACQSGAFSGVKGASPAADFSLSSVNGLHSRGIAVLASSTGSELSQESPELRGSYFTHHLTVGLRGPGDVDGNGRVSLDEAYRYAYDRTLSDTARTRVGMQHATLETNLTGRGDVALTYPSDADAVLLLPATLQGRVLVQRAGHGQVLAELVKAEGLPLSLALPAGRYDVLVRADEAAREARECSLELPRGKPSTLSLAGCRAVQLADPQQKGGEAERHEVWFVELGISGSTQRDDDYTRRLEQFRYHPSIGLDLIGRGVNRDDRVLFLEGAIGRAVHPNLSLLLRFDTFERRFFYRNLVGPGELGQAHRFDWRTQAVSLGARGRVRLWQEYIVAVAELSAGLGMARNTYDIANDVSDKSFTFGPALRAAGGFTFGFNDHFGIYMLGGYAVVRALKNELGDTHEDGGVFGSFGLRVKSLKGWW
jgi:hypothetical protein